MLMSGRVVEYAENIAHVVRVYFFFASRYTHAALME